MLNPSSMKFVSSGTTSTLAIQSSYLLQCTGAWRGFGKRPRINCPHLQSRNCTLHIPVRTSWRKRLLLSSNRHNTPVCHLRHYRGPGQTLTRYYFASTKHSDSQFEALPP
ncbi:hypothetical protein PV05_04395 [Exophiala xenobiotica]|uniref:Uncharacterized protein n=1 Tax=Exophiala xenobiotica TaxID=348802 RepID=A0A0D2F6R5_9EURO|nr:uncharacterized protein PV05_04395 [Exophiala xenobiotica]KIW55664.1 hypothetical protein PV05_04395 [Exophiala xenobiotica]